MTLLVTGSAGHLGEALVRTLRAQGRPVRGLDLKPSPYTDVTCSITDRSAVRASLEGVTAVLHTATLHKPHVATHSQQAFVDTNISGTLTLLEAAVEAGVEALVFTSTTSAFGDALSPAPGAPAAWITEDVAPIPKNIYGVTKLAAEGLCELTWRRRGLPVIILRTARFFPEADDDAQVRGGYDRLNAQANELLNRRLDLEDAVSAHLLAVERAAQIGFGRYILSATTPFAPRDLAQLRAEAAAVVARLYPAFAAEYARRGWRLFPGLDRVYVNARAREALGWRPRRDFGFALETLAAGEDFRSPLALAVGTKGYHDEAFVEGPYPVG